MMSRVDWSSPINWNHPLNRGLVGWWMVTPNASGGTILRDLARNNDGTLTNMDPSTDWMASSRRGGFGSLDFDGSNDYINADTFFDNSPFPNSASRITINVWFKTTVSQIGEVVSMHNGAGANIFLFLLTTTDDRFAVVIFGTPGGSPILNTVFGPTGLNDGKWHMVTFAEDSVGETYNAYVDGVQFGVTPGSGDTAFHEATRLSFGQEWDGGSTSDHFNGQIDDVRIWDRTLNASEVRQYYQLSQRYYPGILNRTRRVFKAPAAAGGLSIPIAMHHYKQLMGAN